MNSAYLNERRGNHPSATGAGAESRSVSPAERRSSRGRRRQLDQNSPVVTGPFSPESARPASLPRPVPDAALRCGKIRRVSVRNRFHLSAFVRNLEDAKKFYESALGFAPIRHYPSVVHYDFFGNHLVLHERPDATRDPIFVREGGASVPMPHFGVILNRPQYEALASRIPANGRDFLVAPHRRFGGTPHEQDVFFVTDGAGNILEFKVYTQTDDDLR